MTFPDECLLETDRRLVDNKQNFAVLLEAEFPPLLCEGGQSYTLISFNTKSGQNLAVCILLHSMKICSIEPGRFKTPSSAATSNIIQRATAPYILIIAETCRSAGAAFPVLQGGVGFEESQWSFDIKGASQHQASSACTEQWRWRW